MPTDLHEWTLSLAASFQKAMALLRNLSDSDIYMLACDCHPWDGQLSLAALTVKEFEQDSELANAEEMAAWELFDFTRELDFWPTHLLDEMRGNYSSSTDKSGITQVYLKACAEALISVDVSVLGSTKKPILSVTHPDTGEEFI